MQPDPVTQLEERTGTSWGFLTRARKTAEATQKRLEDVLLKQTVRFPSDDTSIVVFGSLARGEWTSGSDLDWTFLVDGGARTEHYDVTERIRQILENAGYKTPSPVGPFAHMTFSHELVHHIGGPDDTNRNITQRMLLLLESACLGNGSSRPTIE